MSYAKVLSSPDNEEEDVIATTFAVSSSVLVDHVGNTSGVRRFRGSDSTRHSSNLSERAQAILGRLTWSDSFYEHSTDNVLAVFDINVKTIKETLKAQLLAMSIAFLSAIVGSVVAAILSDIGYFLLVIFFPFIWVPPEAASAIKELHMVGRRHIAVTTSGICLDVADETDPLQLTQRQILKFEDIKRCQVEETGCFLPSFEVSIAVKPKSSMRGTTIPRLCNGQAFVDLVSAMMESIPDASSDATQEHDASKSNCHEAVAIEMV